MIAIESIVLSWLAVMLIFFTCKCVIHLLHKKLKDQGQFLNMQLSNLQSSHERMVNYTSIFIFVIFVFQIFPEYDVVHLLNHVQSSTDSSDSSEDMAEQPSSLPNP